MENQKKLQKSLISTTSRCMKDYNMIENGDHYYSDMHFRGGKDSFTMLDLMIHFQKYGNVNFDFTVVNMDQKQPGFPEEILPNYLDEIGVNYCIIEKDTYSIVKEKIPEGKTMCSLCSRLRRGTLYDKARELGCNN